MEFLVGRFVSKTYLLAFAITYQYESETLLSTVCNERVLYLRYISKFLASSERGTYKHTKINYLDRVLTKNDWYDKF